ncbi:MAG TPA: hypothetical protein VLZ89_13005 [Anaerolineales bacterium]|nr:hypothetical protein [Anaerolineales bacterium]
MNILRGAWGAVMGVMVAAAVLGMLAQLVRLSGSAALGAPMITARAASSMLGMIVVVLYAYLAVPAIVRAVSSSALGGGGCGPAAELGQAAAYAMAAITSLRIAKATLISIFSAMSGAQTGMSYAISEAAESIIGMLLISIAVPVAAAFLGAC